jgi:hypothetical protein
MPTIPTLLVLLVYVFCVSGLRPVINDNFVVGVDGWSRAANRYKTMFSETPDDTAFMYEDGHRLVGGRYGMWGFRPKVWEDNGLDIDGNWTVRLGFKHLGTHNSTCM